LSSCSQIAQDIPACQNAGKKVFLSLAGGYPTTQHLSGDDAANSFADFLWNAFGPVSEDWVNAGNPRPFGDVVVDGFDFDVEHNGGTGACLYLHPYHLLEKQRWEQLIVWRKI
jgi:chitinase